MSRAPLVGDHGGRGERVLPPRSTISSSFSSIVEDYRFQERRDAGEKDDRVTDDKEVVVFGGGPKSIAYIDYSRSLPDEGECTAEAAAAASSVLHAAQPQRRGSRNESFPLKLHRILSDAEPGGFDDCIAWLSHGRSFRILSSTELEERVLPRYFSSSRMTSFMRQVNGWGFRRVGNGPSVGSYYHELCLKGLPHLARRIYKPRTGELCKSKKEKKSAAVAPNFEAISRERPLPCGIKKELEDPLSQANPRREGSTSAAASEVTSSSSRPRDEPLAASATASSTLLSSPNARPSLVAFAPPQPGRRATSTLSGANEDSVKALLTQLLRQLQTQQLEQLQQQTPQLNQAEQQQAQSILWQLSQQLRSQQSQRPQNGQHTQLLLQTLQQLLQISPECVMQLVCVLQPQQPSAPSPMAPNNAAITSIQSLLAGGVNAGLVESPTPTAAPLLHSRDPAAVQAAATILGQVPGLAVVAMPASPDGGISVETSQQGNVLSSRLPLLSQQQRQRLVLEQQYPQLVGLWAGQQSAAANTAPGGTNLACDILSLFSGLRPAAVHVPQRPPPSQEEVQEGIQMALRLLQQRQGSPLLTKNGGRVYHE
mmetsp:Transcript_47025/g.142388  ORF Transcript_47025/g.142388 Transcript_47025/m.142388 type:complete len:597 (-) Transcript_47025:257-2047(-)